MDETVIDIGFNVDQKTDDKAKKSFKDMTSLIADLALIGKVAGETLGKLWDSVSGSINIGVKGFQNSINAMVRSFTSSGFNKLTEALSNIGAPGTEKDIVGSIYNLIRSVNNPETGADYLVNLQKQLGVHGVGKGQRDDLAAAIKSESGENVLMMVGEILNSLPKEQGAKAADLLNVSALATLSDDTQWKQFQDIMNSTSIVYEQNMEVLDALNDSVAEIKGTFEGLSKSIAEDFTPAITLFSDKFREWTEKYLSFKGDLDSKAEAYLNSEQFEEDKKNPNSGMSRYMPNTYEATGINNPFSMQNNMQDWMKNANKAVELSAADKLDSYTTGGLDYGKSDGSLGSIRDYITEAVKAEKHLRTVNIDSVNFNELDGNFVEQLLEQVDEMVVH